MSGGWSSHALRRCTVNLILRTNNAVLVHEYEAAVRRKAGTVVTFAGAGSQAT